MMVMMVMMVMFYFFMTDVRVNAILAGTIFCKINFREKCEDRHITSICHPPTYLNKILIAFDDGSLEILNTRKLVRIFAFDPRKLGTQGMTTSLFLRWWRLSIRCSLVPRIGLELTI